MEVDEIGPVTYHEPNHDCSHRNGEVFATPYIMLLSNFSRVAHIQFHKKKLSWTKRVLIQWQKQV